MRVTQTFIKNLRTLIEREYPKEGEIYRFKGVGNLWFSVDKHVDGRTFDGVEYTFVYQYSLEVDGRLYHFFGRFEQEKNPDA